MAALPMTSRSSQFAEPIWGRRSAPASGHGRVAPARAERAPHIRARSCHSDRPRSGVALLRMTAWSAGQWMGRSAVIAPLLPFQFVTAGLPAGGHKLNDGSPGHARDGDRDEHLRHLPRRGGEARRRADGRGAGRGRRAVRASSRSCCASPGRRWWTGGPQGRLRPRRGVAAGAPALPGVRRREGAPPARGCRCAPTAAARCTSRAERTSTSCRSASWAMIRHGENRR